MAKTQTTLQVFVASPGDVAEERKLLEDVINEINLTLSKSHNVRLELVKWETHTRPGIGQDAQDVINRQIGDQYDVFIGIMWGRFGSPTNRAESGTEEEFERAYSRLKSSPGSVEIMFYFKDAGIAPSELDPAQIAKVQQFKKKISSEFGALYHEFEQTDTFESKARIHLSTFVQDWLRGGQARTDDKNVIAAAPIPATPNPLANLMALTEDDQLDGIFDLSERGTDAMTIVASVIEKMGDAITELSGKFVERTKEINELTSGGSRLDPKSAKRIANNAAGDLEFYVKRMSVEIPEFHTQHSLAMDMFGKLAMMSASDITEEPDDVKRLLEVMREYRTNIATASGHLSNLRDSVAKIPRMTSAFYHARRRAVAVMDDLLVQFRSAANQAADVVPLLERMIDDSESSGS